MRSTCSALAVLFLTSAASAGTYFAIGEVPGGHSTTLLGINGKNQLVGWYTGTGTATHGFAADLGGAFTTFDVGTGFTLARAINNAGTIVGDFTNQGSGEFYAFERFADGRTAAIKDGHQVMKEAVLFGLNNQGVFVGTAIVDHDDIAFTGQKARYAATLDTPLYLPEPHAVNASNVVVGYFYDPGQPGFTDHGFILKDGTATQLDFPAANDHGTRLNGINDAGIVTGYWLDQHRRYHAFRYDMGTATFTALHPPGTPYSQAWGINEKGLIAMTSALGSFVYCPKARQCPAGSRRGRRRARACGATQSLTSLSMAPPILG
ncbi:MAG: hypothetical protein JOZ72_13300 [Alphaproteobacteria bacterium]|nr:hypothetical protein [Alphaproteobacteria bacterium]